MTILLEVAHPTYAEARDRIAPFTELLKSPEHMHTYGISHLSLWNAASSGHSAKEVLDTLRQYSRFELPHNLVTEVETFMERYGQVRILREDGKLILETLDPALLLEIVNHRQTSPFVEKQIDERRAYLFPHTRGMIKMALTNIGFPAEDLAGYVEGTPMEVAVRDVTLEGKPLNL